MFVCTFVAFGVYSPRAAFKLFRIMRDGIQTKHTNIDGTHNNGVPARDLSCCCCGWLLLQMCTHNKRVIPHCCDEVETQLAKQQKKKKN